MNQRKLGNTGLDLSEVGFGAWAIGGGDWRFGWGPQDDGEAVAAIRRALELGVNWIDTAAVYGLGHSEELVAKAVEGRRDEVIIATKCSLVWNDKREVSSSLRSDSVKRECEASLRRLNTDHIDIYQIHWPEDEERIEEGWQAIGELIDAGKVRYGGVSNFDTGQMERARKIRSVSSLQPPYSLLRRGVESEILSHCRRHSIGVVAYSPMLNGLLTGKFDLNYVAMDDWRRGAVEFNQPNLKVNLGFVEKLRPIAAGYGKTVAQLAIAWVLRDEVVTSAIVGARRPSQIEETVGGAGWKIDPADLQSIDDHLDERARRVEAAGGKVKR